MGLSEYKLSKVNGRSIVEFDDTRSNKEFLGSQPKTKTVQSDKLGLDLNGLIHGR